MKKRVLAVYFTQSGQTREILDRLLEPLAESPEVELTWEELRCREPFPFPWSLRSFFDAFPESVRCLPRPLEATGFDPAARYDLVVIGWQPWFLSPSIPVSSFLQTAAAKQALAGTPVVTVTGCRNMWISGLEKLKRLLAAAGGRLVGNVVLVDRAPNLVSVATILHWMLTGRREGFLGVFPEAGVLRADVRASIGFGECLRRHLAAGTWGELQGELRRLGAVAVTPSLMAIETRGSRIFDLWAAWVLRRGGAGRRWKLRLFAVYLPTVLVLAAPIAPLLAWVQGRLFRKRARAAVDYYSGVDLRPRHG